MYHFQIRFVWKPTWPVYNTTNRYIKIGAHSNKNRPKIILSWWTGRRKQTRTAQRYWRKKKIGTQFINLENQMEHTHTLTDRYTQCSFQWGLIILDVVARCCPLPTYNQQHTIDQLIFSFKHSCHRRWPCWMSLLIAIFYCAVLRFEFVWIPKFVTVFVNVLIFLPSVSWGCCLCTFFFFIMSAVYKLPECNGFDVTFSGIGSIDAGLFLLFSFRFTTLCWWSSLCVWADTLQSEKQNSM